MTGEDQTLPPFVRGPAPFTVKVGDKAEPELAPQTPPLTPAQPWPFAPPQATE